jgi:hypothetical protein
VIHPNLSPKFLQFLEDYSRKSGRDPAVLIEEAVSQAILRHEAASGDAAHTALLMPQATQNRILGRLPEFDPAHGADTAFGDFMERLPDRNWYYQVGRLDEWWFLVVSLLPQDLPEPLELRSVETSQAYAWLFGFTKTVRLWSAPDRFLLAF